MLELLVVEDVEGLLVGEADAGEEDVGQIKTTSNPYKHELWSSVLAVEGFWEI